ncbi:MAG TPA: ISAs1 family transposase [Nitrososphaera sp.]|nr:ISAs1 family transposase [Nitrososphaera sp.]
MESPIKYFTSLNDFRQLGKVKHKLENIIAITIAAVICGCENWYEIEDYGKQKEPWLKTFLDLPYGVPTHDTYRRFFMWVNPKKLEQCFIEWIKSVCDITEGRIINIDGKCLRGSKGDNASFVHMVSAWCNTNNMVLAQEKVDDKSNEITAIPALLEILVLKGCMVTLDAMGCQRTIAEKIVEANADYLLSVKGNQEFLLDDITEAFTYGKTEDEYIEKEVGHGRVESRTTRVITDVNWICNKEEWKKLACIIMVFATRYNKKTGAEEQSVRYYISSKTASAKYFYEAVRSHWGIENKLHWCMDVIFGEDNSRKQAENSAQNFSLVNKVALNMIRNYKPDEARGSKKISMIRKRKMANRENEYLLNILFSFKTTMQ